MLRFLNRKILHYISLNFFLAIGLDVVSAESLFGFEPQHEHPDLSTSAITEEKVNLPDSSILQPAIQVNIIKLF